MHEYLYKVITRKINLDWDLFTQLAKKMKENFKQLLVYPS